MSDISEFVVEKYFGSDQGSILIKYLINSYNDFVLRKIDDIIEGFNKGPIEIPHQFLPDHNCYKYILKIFVENPVLSKPMIVEKDGSTKIMTPTDARNRNFTYSSNINVDINIQAMVFSEEMNSYYEETKKINNVNLGKIPIMVKSKYCVLSEHAHLNKDECNYDYGGYFIVNGNEKVVISQDRIAENKINVFVNNKNTTYSHIAEIRSVQENKFSVPKTNTMKLTSKPNQFGRAVRVNIHHIKHDIPVTILFRALGVQTDNEIVKYILLNEADNKMLQKELIGSFEEGNVISCQRDAYEYLNKFMVINGYNKDLHSNKAKRIELITDILKNEFLPHVGTDFHKKALFLGSMMNKLIKCYLGLIPFDDRDSYINKRIDTPGILMANLFRQYYGKVIKDMKALVTKDLNSATWKNSSKLINIINNVNVSRLFKSSIIESGMKFSLATGNWGIKSNKTKQGVAQVLNRLTYSATLSHLRRINTPVEKTGKLVQPRKLHSTQYGIICPAETPEGVSVGLVKNMSLIASITVASNSSTVREYLREGYMGVSPMTMFDGTNIDIFNNKAAVKVVVNGDTIGVHENPCKLFQMLKYIKRSGIINIYTSITWNIFKNEISIYTEGGRCVRPTIIVEQPNNKCSIDTEFVKNNPNITWNELCIDKNMIEYLDLDEANSSMIAMSFDKLNEKPIDVNSHPVEYTHMEINPSLILGVLAASIPFSNHNQAPRNCYQCLSIEEEVLMSDGSRKKIKNVKVGDEVITFDNKTMYASKSKVINQYVRPTDKIIYELTTISGRKITATGNHPFMTSKGWQMTEYITNEDNIGVFVDNLEDICDGYDQDFKILNIDTFVANMSFLELNPYKYVYDLMNIGLLPLNINNPKMNILMRIFGYLYLQYKPFEINGEAIDMFVQTNNYEDSKYFIDDMKELMNGMHIDSEFNGHYLQFSNNCIIALLFSLGLFEYQNLPTWLFEGPLKLKKEFLSGLQGYNNCAYSCDLSNKIVSQVVYADNICKIFNISNLYKEMGIKPKVSSDSTIEFDDNDYDAIISKIGYKYNHVAATSSAIVMEYLNSNVQESFMSFKNKIHTKSYSIFVPIARKVIVKNQLISDITVESKNHSFITTGGIMSSNSAMGKQAIGIYASNFRKRYDTIGHILNYPQKPLVQTDMARIVNNDKLPCGANIIVAIATFTGFNQEDSVMINKASIDRGLFMSTHYKTYKEQNNKNHSTGEEEFFCKPCPDMTRKLKPFNYNKLEDNGFVKVNTFVESGDIIIGKCMPNKEGNVIHHKDSSVVIKNNEEGYIDYNYNHDHNNVNGDGYTFAKVRIRNMRSPCIGDKFCVPGETDVLVRIDNMIMWKPIVDVVVGDLILQLDPNTNVADFAPVSAKYKFNHDGNMIRFKGENCDLLVTEEHKMFVTDIKNYELKEAKYITGSETFSASCDDAMFDNHTDNERKFVSDLAYIYGLFLFHGQCRRVGENLTGEIEIKKTDVMVEILERDGIEYKNLGDDKIVFRHMFMANLFYGNYFENWVTVNRDSTLCYLNGVFQKEVYYTTKDIANYIHIIGIKAGQNIVSEQCDPNNPKVYSVRRSHGMIRDYEISKEHFEGKVYCVECPTHVFMVKYNGKCMWTGNSSRHGQKGTVGMIYTQEEMPFTKDGLVPDMIINPHAIPSRMTIAQLMECLMSKAACMHNCEGNGSPFQNLSVEDIAAALEQAGMERYGNELMYNPRTGEQINTPIFIGPTYYQRLKHMVKDKIHSRSSCGPVVLITRQPAEGRARDGGLRLGEMEVECNWAHGISSFLKERIMECSDNYRVFVCKKCKMMANVNPDKNIYMCKGCKNTTQFAEVRIPYASKLLLQEIQSMSIGTKFIT